MWSDLLTGVSHHEATKAKSGASVVGLATEVAKKQPQWN